MLFFSEFQKYPLSSFLLLKEKIRNIITVIYRFFPKKFIILYF